MKVVSGMRRYGKSYRLFQEIERLESLGVPASRICYFNFNDDRLNPVTSARGDEVLETFYELHPDALSDGAYLFFDELQEMEDWSTWLCRVVATHKVTIYVSGSSSKMLSREIVTEFRGRALEFELLSFSFVEYARARGIATRSSRVDALSTESRVRLQAAFAQYLECGGFPATFDLPRPHAIALLQSYAQQVVARDVIERHNIAHPRVASLFAQRLLGTNARQLSLRKTANGLRPAGLSTTKETLGDLLAYFQEAHLAFGVEELFYALSESTTSRPKIYADDPGLALACAKAQTVDVGQRLEGAVYLELRRRMTGTRRDALSSLRTAAHGYEVDFVIGDALSSEVFELYQATVDADDESTYRREVRAL